ncbi:EAL domain-containing protein [Actinoplanes couchii]|nr:EAL domain-containing protein [Actinoplanes couchii]MDR6320349.1 EAL domain-containing protein (putative c-di-GMP-specific phosphodiesterase class I) [Actinoplanes couchii]
MTEVTSPRRAAQMTVGDVITGRLVRPVFQPIVDLAGGGVVGLEALARGPAGTALEFPDRLFDAARAAGRLGDLDQLCAERALEVAVDAAVQPPMLFVNAEPAVVDQPISTRIAELVVAGLPFREVLEFTERALPTVPGSMLRLAGLTRAFGHAVALDDVGVDPMSLAFLPILEPEVIKLDLSLIRDPASAATARVSAVVRAQAARTGARIIAEGIETAADLAVARDLGAHWGQGWHFARPGPIDGPGHRYDPEAAAVLPAPPSTFHERPGSPFTATATSGPTFAADSMSIATALDRLHGMLARDPDVIVFAVEPAGTCPELPVSLHDLLGRARSVYIRDRPFPDEFAVVLLGAGYGFGMCVRTRPELEIRHLDQLPAVAEVARVMLAA